MKPMFRNAMAVSAIAGLGIAALPVSAHHTASMFESVKIVQLTGTITEVRWTNPHVNIMVNATVKAGGAEVTACSTREISACSGWASSTGPVWAFTAST